MGVSLIVNRQAEHLRAARSRLLAAYSERIIATKKGVEVYETRSLAELDRAVGEIRRKCAGGDGNDVVVLAGGDGSYSAGVTALAKAFGDANVPRVAFAPGGTVSTVAKNWGMRGSRTKYVERLFETIATNVATKTIVRPTLKVNDRIGFIFGAGLVASFFREYYGSPHRGTLGAARIVAPIFAGSFVGSALAKRVLEPVPCALSIDDVPQHARGYSLIAASVVRDLGLHMWVTYRAGEEMDRFHAIASPLGTRELGPQMPRVILGKRLHGEDHVDALATSLTIDFERDGAYVLDGDLLEGDSVRVTSGPRLRVVTISPDG